MAHGQLFVFVTVWRGSMVMSWVTDVHGGQTELVEEARLHISGRYMTCRPDLLARPSVTGPAPPATSRHRHPQGDTGSFKDSRGSGIQSASRAFNRARSSIE
jgi:hypothetical protein